MSGAEPRAEGLRVHIAEVLWRENTNRAWGEAIDTIDGIATELTALAVLAATPPQRAVPNPCCGTVGVHAIDCRDSFDFMGVPDHEHDPADCAACRDLANGAWDDGARAVPEAASPTLREALGRDQANTEIDLHDLLRHTFAALASQPTPAPLDVEHAARSHYAQNVDCGDLTCPLNWRTAQQDTPEPTGETP